MPETNTKKPLNIVTICASGDKAIDTNINAQRIALLEQSVQTILKSNWQELHAVVLPGGHFFAPFACGRLDYAGRKQALEVTEFAQALQKASKQLHTRYLDITVICGVDSAKASDWESGDELCIAWNRSGIIGIGRKVFPTDRDSNGTGKGTSIAGYSEDYDSPHRVVTLSSGHRALLCACYDMFGLNEPIEAFSPRKKYMRHIYHEGQLHQGSNKLLNPLRQQLITRWHNMIKQEQVDIAISAIHRFSAPNKDCFWQRHGIATASAALKGNLAIAASHFLKLPYAMESPLAAFNVAAEHLTQAQYRKAHHYFATEGMTINSGEDKALIRCYSVRQ